MQHKQNVFSKLSDCLENYLLLAPTRGARIYACNQHQKAVACEHLKYLVNEPLSLFGACSKLEPLIPLHL